LNHGVPFVAVIASQKKAGLIRNHLIENNVSDELMANLHSPAGLDLKAKTAEEIALSIMSEIVMHRNSGSGKGLGK
ncbi:MAG: XdhC family protein, partial [Candidatus Marinimicrobia bacterium]|nr:XdhC family protein [Candidatus Neomarinimicrobiota bacterium]